MISSSCECTSESRTRTLCRDSGAIGQELGNCFLRIFTGFCFRTASPCWNSLAYASDSGLGQLLVRPFVFNGVCRGELPGDEGPQSDQAAGAAGGKVRLRKRCKLGI